MKAYVLEQRRGARASERIMRGLGELLYRGVLVPLVAFFPAPVAYRVACLRGDWCYRHHARVREQIMSNLAGVLGNQLSVEERARVTRNFFRRRACEPVDVMRLSGSGRALARLVEIRGVEHVESALAAGRGAIICCAHFGSFNSCFSLLGARGFPVTAVGDWRSTYDSSMSPLQRLLWRLFQEKPLARHRHRPNIEPATDQHGAAIRMAETLHSNELIAIALETPLSAEERARAIPVDFLGQHIPILPGIVSVARLTGSPVLVMVARRQADWRHQVLEISPPVPLDSDTVTAFKQCVAMVEAPVHQNLSHWDYWGSTQNLIDLGLLPTLAIT